MSLVCSSRDYIITLIPGETTGYFYWDKVAKALYSRTYAYVTDFYELNTGSIIDVIEEFINTGSETGYVVSLVRKGPDGYSPVTFTPLPSTSGDFHNKLLSATVTGSTLTIKMYATVAKEITTYVFTLQTVSSSSPPVSFTPCFNNFILPSDVILSQWCDGFTLNQLYSDGSGGTTLVQTSNSTACGYAPPVQPYRISEEKIIQYRACNYSNPVFIKWKNTIGGWEGFLFETNQIENEDIESIGTFQTNYTRIGDITNPETEIGKSARSRTVFHADQLSLQEKIGLSSLLRSNKVYILNQDGSENCEVRILPGSFLIRETKNKTHEITFEILNPPINTIRN